MGLLREDLIYILLLMMQLCLVRDSSVFVCYIVTCLCLYILLSMSLAVVLEKDGEDQLDRSCEK